MLLSVRNNYSEDQLMHIFLNNFRQSEKYSTQIASHQEELRREGEFTDPKSLYFSSPQTHYIIIDISSGYGRNN